MKKTQLLFIAIIVLFASCSKEPTGPDRFASFESSATNVFLGEEVSFTNTSENATVFRWDFGDGNKSQEKDPVHQYKQAGTYTVSLQVGPSSFARKTIKVHDGDRAVVFTNNMEQDLDITLFDWVTPEEIGDVRHKLGVIKSGTKSDTLYVYESALGINGIKNGKSFIVIDPDTFALKAFNLEKGEFNALEINEDTKTIGVGLPE
jgi:hypothetical protein